MKTCHYGLKDLTSDQNGTVGASGHILSQVTSLPWKQPPIPTVMGMG